MWVLFLLVLCVNAQRGSGSDAGDVTPGSKPSAEKTMTDGCGLINGSAMLSIARHFRYPSRPTAIQGRIAGAKGLWVLHPDDRDPEAPPRIWIRNSQNKINLPAYTQLDRGRRIFDLVAPQRVSTPYRLSAQSLVNLSHNGISNQLFISLMIHGLTESIRGLTEWNAPNAMIRLWDAINKSGHVTGVRYQRQAGGSSRALGFQGRSYGQQDEEATDESDEEEAGPYTDSGRHKYSGLPVSLYESAMELVQAGFHPLQSPYLREKLSRIVTYAIDDSLEKFWIPVEQSLEGFIIPGTTSTCFF